MIILTDIYEFEVKGNCGYFRRILSFIFYKMEFPFFTEVSRNIWRWSHPSLHCASTTCATEHARGIPACIFEHAQKTDAPELALWQKWCSVTSSSNTTCQPLLLAPSLAWPVIMYPDNTIAKAMTCVRMKTTILTRCLAMEGAVPIIARCQYSSRDDRVQTRVGTSTRTSASPCSHGKHKYPVCIFWL